MLFHLATVVSRLKKCAFPFDLKSTPTILEIGEKRSRKRVFVRADALVNSKYNNRKRPEMKISSNFLRNSVSTVLSMLVLLAPGASMASFPDAKGEPVVQQGLGIAPDFGKWPDGMVPWVYNSTNAPSGENR